MVTTGRCFEALFGLHNAASGCLAWWLHHRGPGMTSLSSLVKQGAPEGLGKRSPALVIRPRRPSSEASREQNRAPREEPAEKAGPLGGRCGGAYEEQELDLKILSPLPWTE